MASNPILSAGVRQNLQALQGIAKSTTMTEGRLATGKKVNSALDNPVNYFTSAALSDRAADLTDLLDGVSNAIQTLQAAANGIESITSLVKNAQSAAKQALQTADASSDAAITTDNTTAFTKSTSLSSLGFEAGNTVTFTTGDPAGTGSGTLTFTIGASSTIGDLMKAVNSSTLDIKATLNDSGQLDIEEVGGEDLSIAVADGAGSTAGNAITAAAALGLSGGTPSDSDGDTVDDTYTVTNAATVSTARQKYVDQYNEILVQIDQMAKDSGYNGLNLLQNDNIDVVFNEKTGSEKSKMTISGVSIDAAGLGLEELNATAFQTNTGVESILDKLNDSLTSLRTVSSAFGSNLAVVQSRQTFTNAMVNTLSIGADALVTADTSAESANLLALQTRQQLSTKALSLANQADQSVLNLFN